MTNAVKSISTSAILYDAAASCAIHHVLAMRECCDCVRHVAVRFVLELHACSYQQLSTFEVTA